MYHEMKQRQFPHVFTPSLFRDHLNELAKKHFHIISMEKYLNFVEKNDPIPPNAVVITFDDGYESFYRYAFPELKKHGFPAVNFLIVKSSDVVNPHALPHLQWNQIKEMKKEGMSFYNHTYDLHRIFKRGSLLSEHILLPEKHRLETDTEYRQRVANDLSLAEKRLHDELGNQPRLLAFPYGAYNDELIEIGNQLRFQLYFTVIPGINAKNRIVYRVNAGEPYVSADILVQKMKAVID